MAAALLIIMPLASRCARPPSDAATVETRPPSVILIVIDTLRADYLGCYGFEGPISPNLDELARQSVLFERCSSQAPWTTPSMAALMTSLYPEAHGVRLAPGDPRDQQSWRERWTRAIPESTTTLAELLRDRGYRTAAFIANPFLARGLGFEQGFDTFDESAAVDRVRDSSSLLEAGLEWLRTTTQAGDPTFLYLHLMDVHGPYAAPDADFVAVRESPGLGEAVTLPQWGLRRIQPYLQTPAWTTQPGWNQLRVWRGRYGAGVHASDRRLGTFIQALRDQDLWDEQLVLVTSDHGEELFDHGGWDHGFSLHEHQLHVPLIVRFPEDRHGGTRVGPLVRLVDLMPSLLGLAGVKAPPDTIGGQVLRLDGTPHEALEQRFAFATSVKEHPGNTSIFDGRYKLISDLTNLRLRLYDIDADPHEQTDISARHPEVLGNLVVRLREETQKVTPGDSDQDDATEISAEQLERLRELGYFQ